MKRLVLVGPGHGHLFVLERLARERPKDLEVVLVSLGTRQWYSGMLPGALAGQYGPDDWSFDLEAICRNLGVRLEPSGAAAVDAQAQIVMLQSGARLDYDVVSLDVGSSAAGDETPGVAEHAFQLKPLSRAPSLEGILQRTGPLGVVGGGAAGVELAFCLRARTGRRTVLLESGEHVPGGASRALEACVLRILAQKGVELRRGAAVVGVSASGVRLSSGEEVLAGGVFWATGAKAPSSLEVRSAALDSKGFLSIRDTLQSVSHPNLFAAGDCTGFASGQRVPRAGVSAVRQGPVLARNLLARLEGGTFQRFRAQADFLRLLNVGDGTAIGAWRGLAWHGRAMGRLKDSIDRRFMRRFKKLA